MRKAEPRVQLQPLLTAVCFGLQRLASLCAAVRPSLSQRPLQFAASCRERRCPCCLFYWLISKGRRGGPGSGVSGGSLRHLPCTYMPVSLLASSLAQCKNGRELAASCAAWPSYDTRSLFRQASAFSAQLWAAKGKRAFRQGEKVACLGSCGSFMVEHAAERVGSPVASDPWMFSDHLWKS